MKQFLKRAFLPLALALTALTATAAPAMAATFEFYPTGVQWSDPNNYVLDFVQDGSGNTINLWEPFFSGITTIAVAPATSAGTPYRVAYYDASTDTVYGPWYYTDTAPHAWSVPSARKNDSFYPMMTHHNSNHGGKNYGGAYTT